MGGILGCVGECEGGQTGKVTIETGISKKEAADIYILEPSAHPLTRDESGQGTKE